MAERLRKSFPSHEVLPAASLMAAVPEEVPTPIIPYHRFRSKSPNALVQTGPRLLTVNILPVYPGFEVFRNLILEVLENYRSIAEPGSPTRIGLRYINHIRSTPGVQDISRYLKCSFSYPAELPHPPNELATRLILPHGELGTLALAIGFPARIGEGQYGALLDLDFYCSEPKEFALERIPDWLDEAHGIIYGAFKATIPENVMQMLQGGQ